MLGRAGWIDLDPAFADLERMPVILALLALFILDFVADKIPVVDHAMHTAGLVIHPAVGAVLFDVQAGGEVPVLVNLIAGASVAGTLHTARATARPAINGVSAGLGAPIASLAEDLAAVLLTIVALLLPVVAGLAVIAMLLGAFFVARRLRRMVRRRTALATTPRYPSHVRRGGDEPPPRRRRSGPGGPGGRFSR